MSVKTKKPETRNGHYLKYQPILLVSIYRYARIGMPEVGIAEALGIGTTTWDRWKRKFPDIAKAVALGRTDTKDGGSWHQFVYDRLSPDLKTLWDKIESWDELPNGVAKIEALLQDHGKAIRQQLFLHALIHTNFSASRAMAKVNIAKRTLDDWIRNDPAFAEMVEEIQWHKGNFYEESLVSLVKGGDTGATLFANRTFNKDRGYAVKSEIDVRHSGQIEHTLDLSELELTQAVRMAIMEAIRRRDEKLIEDRARATIPVEFKVLQEQIAALPEEEVPVS